ncbi:prohibitin-1, mitochondrial-like [Salvia miltiorrhiza]|uniref:prohibitin-1, mitochondrial-like n=1 Tax=Salvia miltiorrhiza TaxID=226208 RepID=UPI0025ABC3E2|nr:prohibitin-1, mitochondrial-like [Salvia miltiorrhiza]XP_057789462.1 prohibitin-1, mitochondrial-like [Salvia miltiorrhiza]
MNFMYMDEHFKKLEKWLQGLPPKKIMGIQRRVAAALGLYLYGATIYTVKPGHRALIFDRRSGLQDRIYPEGTHLKMPILQRKIVYDIRAQPYEVKTNSGSRDLQMIDINVRVLSRPVADELPTIYRSLGEKYKDIILPSIVDETVKAVVAQYNASQLLSQREKVSSEIRGVLKERAAKFHIVLDDVSITNLTFGKEFSAAIEAKQVAAQEAERARYVVELAEQEKQSTILQAQGEAKSAELIGRAIANNPAFIALRRIEASKEISKTIANSSNKVYLDSDRLLLDL